MNKIVFDEHKVLHDLKHYLPSQSPLKDFIHHNTLHAFQHFHFHDAGRIASAIFGFRTSLSISEFRELRSKGAILDRAIDEVIKQKKGEGSIQEWRKKLLHQSYNENIDARMGHVRKAWKEDYKFDMDARVHSNLFRILNSYLDQGIAIWNFPESGKGFLDSFKELESNTYVSFFNSRRVKDFLINDTHEIDQLLRILVGNEAYFERYLFDQQFAHPGWSGLVSVIEENPHTLLSSKKISLKELIQLELMLEIDVLDREFGKRWKPLGEKFELESTDLFEDVPHTEQREVMVLWQEAYEWTYFDQVIAGIQLHPEEKNPKPTKKSFQALFCIDDRECSIRRYIEHFDPECETYGTPGHFGLEFYYQPENGKFHTKVCPAPITPKFLIKEVGSARKQDKDFHFGKQSHHLFGGWVIAQTMGFWSALKLFINVFRPTISPATASSFRHMEKISKLTVEAREEPHQEEGLQVGFTVPEMAERVERVLKSIGLVADFSPLVYMIGHGSSSVNNTHYAGYDCGACSGRPGSANARAFSFMANHTKVRELLIDKGITIPDQTQFIGGLHDTSRDEVEFYDEDSLSPQNLMSHKDRLGVFEKALDLNAKERSRRFQSIDTHDDAVTIHDKVRRRTVSLFEPRPELNHATNALCIIGRREMTKDLFLDRRPFLNSFDYRVDPDGDYLLTILNAASPVCGGINLEYLYSRVDNHKLGAGTKLPHNVMGLIGVANGIEGDLRPGLPYQMIEIHDPIRLMMVVEHFPEVVFETIKRNPATYEWFIHEWVRLVVIHPENKTAYVFEDGKFRVYKPLQTTIDKVADIESLISSTLENLPVVLINQSA